MQAATKVNTAASKSLACRKMGANGSRDLCVGAKAMDEGQNRRSEVSKKVHGILPLSQQAPVRKRKVN
ncbi:MAG: hypothetical protein QHH06_05480 [Clostridiales bacterium]|jgi:hypothetical protein|nr:hypothetical protein [Eubacteriales bacterium]MDH7565917.1 hypothetical protein [Clostridiales bacterium]